MTTDKQREAFEREYATGDAVSDSISLALREDGEYEQALARMCFKWFCKGQAAQRPTCRACGGNDMDMPCAYPCKYEAKRGCLRNFKLSIEAARAESAKEIERIKTDREAEMQSLWRIIESEREEKECLQRVVTWYPMSEYPKEMQPVIAKTSSGTVGIAYCYKLDSEYPQWNFMTMGMNATGMLDKEAKWMHLPEEALAAAQNTEKGTL